jgi:hypothetical protein
MLPRYSAFHHVFIILLSFRESCCPGIVPFTMFSSFFCMLYGPYILRCRAQFGEHLNVPVAYCASRIHRSRELPRDTFCHFHVPACKQSRTTSKQTSASLINRHLNPHTVDVLLSQPSSCQILRLPSPRPVREAHPHLQSPHSRPRISMRPQRRVSTSHPICFD